MAEAVNDYEGPGNILISWRHGKMRELVQALGYDDPPEYPEDRYVGLDILDVSLDFGLGWWENWSKALII